MSATNSTIDVTSDMERVSPEQMLNEIIAYEVEMTTVSEMSAIVVAHTVKRVMDRHWSDTKLAEEYYKMIGEL